jgi:hypothetical protein
MKTKLTGYAKLLIAKKYYSQPSSGHVPSKRSAKNACKTGWSRGVPAFGANIK